jgi:hypothetical protein
MKTYIPYESPDIHVIQLDNSISLVLQSDAPVGPGEEVMNRTPEFFNQQNRV